MSDVELMYSHLKGKAGCPGLDLCDACKLANALYREMRLTASYRNGAEESAKRWNAIDDYEQTKAEVERLRDVLNTQDVQHAHERAVHAKANAQAREEVERLRAENARLEKMLNVCSSVHGHNVALHAKLEWFRRREPFVLELIRQLRAYDEGDPHTYLVGAVRQVAAEWTQNPKPGAGEFATKCTDEDTDVLSDSYDEFAKGAKPGAGT